MGNIQGKLTIAIAIATGIKNPFRQIVIIRNKCADNIILIINQIL